MSAIRRGLGRLSWILLPMRASGSVSIGRVASHRLWASPRRAGTIRPLSLLQNSKASALTFASTVSSTRLGASSRVKDGPAVEVCLHFHLGLQGSGSDGECKEDERLHESKSNIFALSLWIQSLLVSEILLFRGRVFVKGPRFGLSL